jgi:hypothetical protein
MRRTFGRLWYVGPNAISNAIDYAKHRSRSQHAVIRVYDLMFILMLEVRKCHVVLVTY